LEQVYAKKCLSGTLVIFQEHNDPVQSDPVKRKIAWKRWLVEIFLGYIYV